MSVLAIRQLNSTLQQIACEQLHEEPDKIHECLEILREWIGQSAHLKARTNNQFLITFLRGCKYRLEESKKKIDNFYTLRTHAPDVINERDPMNEKLHQMIKLGFTLPLSDTDNSGLPRIILFRVGAYDPNKFTLTEMAKIFIMINDILMIEDDNTVVAGQILVADLRNLTFAHITQMPPPFLKKMFMMLQDGLPIRLKGIHYINAPSIFETVFNLVKSFLNDKMKSRLFVHSSMDSFYNEVSPTLMPAEYGGQAASLQDLTDDWEKKLLSYREYFLEESRQYGVDEKKRIGQQKDSNLIFGFDGTFRQLEFD